MNGMNSMQNSWIEKDWLELRLADNEAMLKHCVSTFGSETQKGEDLIPEHLMEKMKKGMKFNVQPGDEVWYFNSGRASFAVLAGRSGYALVRNGEIVDNIVTWIS